MKEQHIKEPVYDIIHLMKNINLRFCSKSTCDLKAHFLTDRLEHSTVLRKNAIFCTRSTWVYTKPYLLVNQMSFFVLVRLIKFAFVLF